MKTEQFLFECDNCPAEQIIVIRGNYPLGWAMVEVNIGQSHRELMLCQSCIDDLYLVLPAPGNHLARKGGLVPKLKSFFIPRNK